ncbi:MAG: MaoC family dehydratase N-terminal domain-containing protein [Candidatus Tectomicrobia bacterium]
MRLDASEVVEERLEKQSMVNWDRSLLGKTFSRSVERITREMLLDFADLMGTTNPIYVDPQAARAQGYRDIIALPTFIMVRGAIPLVPPELDFHGMGINAGYECTFYETIYPEDTLTFSTCLIDLYEKTGRSGTMRFVVRQTTVTNQHDKTVAVMRNPFILDW